MLKKKIEERKQKLTEMKLDKSAVLQRKLHEENSWTQRLMLFLLVNSILFVSFTTLLGNEAQKLLLAIPSVGIISCLFMVVHTFGVKVESSALDILLNEPERSPLSEIFAGISTGLWIAAVFLGLWIMAILEVVC